MPIARLLGLKVVITHHGPDYERKKWGKLPKLVLKLGERLGCKWANGIIAISKTIAEQVENKYERVVTVIPNGVIIPEIIQSNTTLEKYGLGLKEKARQNSNIVLTGFLAGEPLRELYSHAGLFVLPSYYEGLPIVLLEALSFGLSCIASDIPANREVSMEDDRYFRAGDTEALVSKIKEFIHKPIGVEEKMAQRNRIVEKYDWAKIADKTREVYAAVQS